jgi:hypothetical protein
VNWSNACRGIGKASTPIEYAARLTEVMLLGVVALRAGVKIHYDGANMRVTNSREANPWRAKTSSIVLPRIALSGFADNGPGLDTDCLSVAGVFATYGP